MLTSITCPQCGMTSYNPNDVGWGWCGNCHGYTSPVNVLERARRFIREAEEAARNRPGAPKASGGHGERGFHWTTGSRGT
jgi:hypothetical protein